MNELDARINHKRIVRGIRARPVIVAIFNPIPSHDDDDDDDVEISRRLSLLEIDEALWQPSETDKTIRFVWMPNYTE